MLLRLSLSSTCWRYRTLTTIATVALLCIASSCLALQASSSKRQHVTNNGEQYLGGRRCKVFPCSHVKDEKKKMNPPLVLIGGTAQSITSWEHHMTSLCRDRDVLVYECLGQDPLPPTLEKQHEAEYFNNVSLSVQAKDFENVITKAFPPSDENDILTVDVAGFSFGGRVAMAAAATHSNLIRKLHITGVPANRNAYGRLILSQWKDVLLLPESDDDDGLRSFAWSSLMMTHSPSYLSKNERRIKFWVDYICQFNTVHGIKAILEQTHVEDECDDWHVLSMARRIASSSKEVRGRLAVGSEDALASVEEVQRLSDELGWEEEITVYEGCGHAVVIENARQWRNDLLHFLNHDN